MYFMAERVNTGGTIGFNYERGHGGRMSEGERREIADAYARADERKAREKRNKILFWIIGIVIALGLIGLVIYLLR